MHLPVSYGYCQVITPVGGEPLQNKEMKSEKEKSIGLHSIWKDFSSF